MNEGDESYMLWIRDLTFLGVNYTGYQNSRLVHKQQPADTAAFVDMWSGWHHQVICSKPRPKVSRPQHSLKVNSPRRQEAIITSKLMHQSW